MLVAIMREHVNLKEKDEGRGEGGRERERRKMSRNSAIDDHYLARQPGTRTRLTTPYLNVLGIDIGIERERLDTPLVNGMECTQMNPIHLSVLLEP